MTKVEVGDVLARRELESIHGGGELVAIPDPRRLVHLQFRRYAGCPICHLHLRSFLQRHEEILSAGIREVVVFHSSAETMREFQGDLPFDVIADPDKLLYAEFSVQTSLTSVLNPKSMLAAARGTLRRRSMRGVGGRGEQRLGLPADFLIDPAGRVLAVKYGSYADDQWSVDELLDLANSAKADTGG